MPSKPVKGFWNLIALDREFVAMLLVATTLWMFSVTIKLPFNVPNYYSDVGYLWFRDVYQGHHNLQIPYFDYELEYPQVIGGIILIGQAVSTYFPFLLDQSSTFLWVESLIQYPFMIGTVYNLYVLCGNLRLDRNRLYLYMLTTISFVVYGFYNWDFIVAYFTTLSIWLYLERRFDASALTLTAAVLTKFIPGIMLFPMLACLPNNRARLRFTAIAATAWTAVNAPFAVANFDVWIKLFTGFSGPNHQLQNTWISWVITSVGLGDIISGARAGHILSFGIIFYLVFRAIISKRTPLEKILLSWYAWYGAIYLFDPQMFIQLFPIVVLTPNFKFSLYRLADLLNGVIILFYFLGGKNPGLPQYLTDQLTPFGLINMSAAIRQLIFLGAYFVSFSPLLQKRLQVFDSPLRKNLSSIGSSLFSPTR